MPTQSKHASINIGLIQAREALMTQFRPILNQANITDQQWRIIRLLAENGTLDFQDLANQACILRPSLTGILTRLEKAGLVVRLCRLKYSSAGRLHPQFLISSSLT